MDVLEKREISYPYRNSNPEMFSPLPSRYTDYARAAHNNKTVIILLLLMPLLMTLVAAAVPPGQVCRVSRKAFVHTERQWGVITLERRRPQQRGIATKPN
jgi:hypothetical protein